MIWYDGEETQESVRMRIKRCSCITACKMAEPTLLDKLGVPYRWCVQGVDLDENADAIHRSLQEATGGRGGGWRWPFLGSLRRDAKARSLS